MAAGSDAVSAGIGYSASTAAAFGPKFVRTQPVYWSAVQPTAA